MAQRSTTQLKALYGTSGTIFPDNTTQEISEADMRSFGEDLADSMYNKADNPELATGIPTREYDRAWSSELLFDKNEIEGELHVQTDDITFTVSESGNLTDQWSVYGQRIQTDGEHPIYFVGFNHVANISSGEILEAGTYQFIFWFSNGIARASVMLPSEEVVNLTPLAVPTGFAATPGTDPDTEIDIVWNPVVNASGYELQYSTVGVSGPWSELTTTTSTNYTHTGRTANTTYYYKNRALGDLETFAHSQFVTTAGTTQDAGDTTPPTFDSSVADSATDQPVNRLVIFTADEPVRADDGSEITNANAADFITAVNSSAGAQDITVTIDVTKTIFTIAPNVVWDENDDITLSIDGVEDLNGNELASAFSITFSTSDYTEMVGNHLSLGTQVDSYIAGPDKQYKIEFEFKDIILSGERGLTQKHSSVGMQVSHVWGTNDDTISYKFYRREPGGGGVVGFSSREVVFPDALNGVTSGKMRIEYDGTQDGNNGLDRVKLFLDDVEITAGKNVVPTDGSSIWPWDQTTSTAPFMLRGPTFRHVRNFKVYDGSDTVIVNIPIIRTGTDFSGNDFHGTWI